LIRWFVETVVIAACVLFVGTAYAQHWDAIWKIVAWAVFWISYSFFRRDS